MNTGILAILALVYFMTVKKGAPDPKQGGLPEDTVYGVLQLRMARDWHFGKADTYSASVRFFEPDQFHHSVLYSERGTASDKDSIVPWTDLGKVIDSKGNNYLRTVVVNYMEKKAMEYGKPLAVVETVTSHAGELNKWLSMVDEFLVEMIGVAFGLPPGWYQATKDTLQGNIVADDTGFSWN